eukprot:TRINITY_DN4955_c0_g3_i2.p1 TRINITY_DN4955_c0_g3~~TRINITY_DN4955_c0_g3_i2.p1  ORF type:complete len:357 (+),score=52.27 TRINITY_DN4955_c0_g3_i2:119-1189(+)
MAAYGINLSEIWKETVRAELIKSVVNEIIQFGVKEVVDETGQTLLVEYACNIETKEVIYEGLPLERKVGDFVVRFIRSKALRPRTNRAMCDLPPHDTSKCSLCSGPLRLALRPKLAQVQASQSARNWDCYYNMSPVQPAGHFLILPQIDLTHNQREQKLISSDVTDLIDISFHSSNISLLYDSVRASATQNHIHVHLLVSNHNESLYFIDKYPSSDIQFSDANQNVSVNLIGGDYPAVAIKIQISNQELKINQKIDELQKICWKIVSVMIGEKIPFSMLIKDGVVFVYPRNADHEITEEFPNLLVAGQHLSGLFVVEEEVQFTEVDEQKIMAALKKTSIDQRTAVESILRPVFNHQ